MDTKDLRREIVKTINFYTDISATNSTITHHAVLLTDTDDQQYILTIEKLPRK